MFVKLAVLACSLAVATAVWNGPLAGGQPASLYPAGVSPQACPNFPNCNNPAVAAQPNAPAPYAPAPQWGGQPQQNQWNQSPYNAPAVPQWNPNQQSPLDRGEYIGDGDYHGEGLAEALAPGYSNNGNQWNQGAANQWNQAGANQWNQGGNNQWGGNHWNAGQPAGVGTPAAIPAGVDPGACPNYPFCH